MKFIYLLLASCILSLNLQAKFVCNLNSVLNNQHQFKPLDNTSSKKNIFNIWNPFANFQKKSSAPCDVLTTQQYKNQLTQILLPITNVNSDSIIHQLITEAGTLYDLLLHLHGGCKNSHEIQTHIKLIIKIINEIKQNVELYYGINSIYANNNDIVGNKNVLAGSNTNLNGNSNIVTGNDDIVMGNNDFVIGNGVKVNGSEDIILGSHQTNSGNHELFIGPFKVQIQHETKKINIFDFIKGI